ncbi:family 20 glycosylhydrolase [Mariniflexile sp. AS56]|uniref:family 20 glycosylhydrolase n=1 Tax=Mariniflexile sp. AS56 TaxID=3063957 RepID=UPI0026EC2A62|nr:family 20 glycosylhydrolase [Mariniflexile sp. AS56]MDO7172630.1 family 20 glycosylhydrolase [Mariniflexile sp. AS56]
MKKHITFLLVTLLLVSCSQTKPTFKQEQISLLPKPLSFQLKESSFQFESSTKIILNDESHQKAANYLIGLFKNAAGYNLQVSNTKLDDAVVFETVEGLKEGAYKLDINPTSINIKASEERGFFNAVQTIRQLLPNEIESKEKTNTDWFVPCAMVEDAPRFEWRGMHMDFSRHFFNINEVKDFLDYMALFKLNTYHMHLTDDQGWRIEIKKYPLLTEKGAWRTPNNQDTICMDRAKENKLYTIDESNFKTIDGERKYGGFFTQDQIKEIVSYADARCITVIPEIDMPGHFKSAIDNYPFLSCNEESGWDTVFTYPTCLGKETTYDFMKNVLSEVVELFPAKYVHIGGDEVNIKSWEKCPHCQKAIKEHNLKDEHELQSHFNRDIEQFLQSKGKQFMGWDEIVRGGLTKEANVMWWRNWAPDAPKKAAANGNDIVVTTTAAYYFDYLNEGNTLEGVYNYEPIPEDFTDAEAEHVLGIQANLWSEWIPSFKRLQYQAFPRMLAVAENAWVDQERDFESFNKRVEKQYDRLDVLDVYYYIPAVEGLQKDIAFVDNTEVSLKLAYPLEGVDIYYSLDGSIPTKETIKYEAPFLVNDTITIKARAYRGEKFNDLKTTKVIQKNYITPIEVNPVETGLKRWIIKGKFKKVEDLKTPSTSNFTKVDTIALGDFKDEKNFSIIYQGYFKANKDAIYEFETRSDGGDLLFIGDEVIVDNSGWHGPRKSYGKAALKQGWHPITIKYRPSDKPRVIEVKYAIQGEELTPMSGSVTRF